MSKKVSTTKIKPGTKVKILKAEFVEGALNCAVWDNPSLAAISRACKKEKSVAGLTGMIGNVAADGTAILYDLSAGVAGSMCTVYHPNGKRERMTVARAHTLYTAAWNKIYAPKKAKKK
jgi:hypothetical protein